MNKTKIIAFYLPQYHPTPENDLWWGKGFTEWTNVGKAKPLFPGHYQPKVPTDLGYYDLRVPETRQDQANLASQYGIDGFCYWHYWFAGKQLLYRPFKEVVESGKPNFPFCLCWANHSWSRKTWTPNGEDPLLIEQTYPGRQDYVNHFNEMLPAFKDSRYIRIDGDLLFGIYAPLDIPNFLEFKNLWNNMALENGLGKFKFFGFTMKPELADIILEQGYDTSIVDYVSRGWNKKNPIMGRIKRKILNLPRICDYNRYIQTIRDEYKPSTRKQLCVIPNFDHSPRSMKRGVIYDNATPEAWGALLNYLKNDLCYNEEVLFIKAWNEWGEGNYLEPDIKYGRGYLEEIKKVFK